MDATPLPRADSKPITRWSLFTAFLKVGVLGFGGVAAWVRHIVVVERRWLSEIEFAELFGVSSTLPGANTVNFATMIGDRYAGVTGSCAALAGLLGAPLAILIVAASLYDRFSGLPDVKAALAGAAAAASGLVMGTALKILRNLEPDLVMVLAAVGVFLATAIAQWPIVLTLGLAIPFCLIAAAIKQRRKQP